MKRTTLTLLTLCALTLALTACGASNSAATAAVSQTNSAAGGLSGVNLLLLGTLKLEGTAQAVTTSQAAELLPLWQVYQSLSQSDTTAQAEIDALIQQIQDTMTKDQMTAIQAMNLTQKDSFALMQKMGIQAGMAGGQSSSSGQNNSGFASRQGMGVPPDMGGGGPPGQMPGGQSLSQTQIATAQAARAASGGSSNRVMNNLLNALIEYLQKLAGG